MMAIDRLARIVRLRIRSLFQRDRVEQELDDEMRYHIEQQTESNIRLGMSPDAARREALRAFGGVEFQKEESRDHRGTRWIEDLIGDVKFSMRALRRAPGFTLTVVITLALGIGANTAIFSVVRAVLLKPLPHRHGERLLYLRQSGSGPGQQDINFSVPEVRDLRTRVPSFAGVAEFSSWSSILYEKRAAHRLNVGLVTGNYFEVMGLATEIGRTTGPQDDGVAANPVAVLSHEFWVTHYGANPGIVGTNITLDKHPVTVIGVLEPAPFFPDRVDALLNLVNSAHHLGASMQNQRTHRMTRVVARLTPTTTLERARSEVAGVYSSMMKQNPSDYPAASHYSIEVMTLKEALGHDAQLVLWLLMASAAFVLIVSASNVANLTLMRSVKREHELVVRAALGAGAARLRRLKLAENLVLTTAGAALGMLIAKSGVKVLTAFAARYSPRASDIHLDGVAMAFTLAVAVALAVVLSLFVSIPGDSGIGTRVMSGGQRAGGNSPARQRVQRGLVVLQIAVTIVLLAGAGLLTQTIIRLTHVDTGLGADPLTMRVTMLTGAEARDTNAVKVMQRKFEQIRSDLAALPGVTAVGSGGWAPLRSSGVYYLVEAQGKTDAAGGGTARTEVLTADPNFFLASGIPLLRGRGFTSADADGSTATVIVNKALADRVFANSDPIGKRIGWKVDWRGNDTLTWVTIGGVVGNTLQAGADAVRPTMFFPLSAMGILNPSIIIRADGRDAEMAKTAQAVVRKYSPAAVIENVETLQQFRAETFAKQRLNAVLISSFSALALLIAAVGIAGVLAFSVAARTTEIGIRMSLGADSGRVQRMILTEGTSLVFVGGVLGVIGAMASMGALRGLLFGVSPRDPLTFVAVAAAMAIIGTIACWIPAARAARIDPAIAMRG